MPTLISGQRHPITLPDQIGGYLVARIKHPNPQDGTFTDILGGVVFHDGYAEVDLSEDPNLRDAYLMHAYEVEDVPEFAPVPTAELLAREEASSEKPTSRRGRKA